MTNPLSSDARTAERERRSRQIDARANEIQENAEPVSAVNELRSIASAIRQEPT